MKEAIFDKPFTIKSQFSTTLFLSISQIPTRFGTFSCIKADVFKIKYDKSKYLDTEGCFSFNSFWSWCKEVSFNPSISATIISYCVKGLLFVFMLMNTFNAVSFDVVDGKD